jgi:hypothetical protein
MRSSCCESKDDQSDERADGRVQRMGRNRRAIDVCGVGRDARVVIVNRDEEAV